jgi:hypothetical protein
VLNYSAASSGKTVFEPVQGVIMKEQIILTVGNRMMGDDAAGPLLAALLQRSPAPGWQVLDGGLAPENVVHRVRAIAPGRVLIVDAAEMELEPGEVRLVDDRLNSREPVHGPADVRGRRALSGAAAASPR